MLVMANAKEKVLESPEGLIQKLADKGVTFEKKFSREDAEKYLRENNNYYKLASYRKNFIKGEDGKYIGLDFSYLVDLAIIDMLFRYHIMRMALDIEHFEKVKLLGFLKAKKDDGYMTLESYKESLRTEGEACLERLNREISENGYSIYCKNMIEHVKLGQRMPVWVFLEVISFGRFKMFWEFCANKYNDVSLIEELHRLKKVKSMRNAAGHSSCILNDLRLTSDTQDLNRKVLNKFKKIIPLQYRGNKLEEPSIIQNDRLKEIITLFYVHSSILPSDGMRKHYGKELHDFTVKMNMHVDDYYKDNETIRNAFFIINTIIENWY